MSLLQRLSYRVAMNAAKMLVFGMLVQTAWPVYSQDTTARTNKAKSGWSAFVCFAGQAKGDMVIQDHLEDSLTFTDPGAIEHHRVKSFRMTVTCNGVPLKYLENKSGNRLTKEMKEAVVKFHPGCILVFDAIKIEWISKEFKGASDFNAGSPLRFTLR